MGEDRRPVRLGGVRGRLARLLLGGPRLVHNGVPVDAYPERAWHLVPFPAQKGRPFEADNLATVMGHPFLDDAEFRAARTAAESRWPADEVRDVTWRLHVALWSVATACGIHDDGDLVELGTGRGYMAAGIATALGEVLADRTLVLVDRFATEVPSAGAGADGSGAPFCYTDDVEEVRRHFAPHPFVRVLRADLPEGIGRLPTERVCWVHVDLNDPDVELASLRALRPRLAPGAVLLFDDTGNPGYERSAEAHRRLMAEWGAPLLHLPTGQSLAVAP